MAKKITIGLPRINLEPGEKRDFLPEFVGYLQHYGAQVIMERGYGSGMGFSEDDYLSTAPGASFSTIEDAYRQDIVIVLRYPGDDKLHLMREDACLVSMLHYPTRPQRVAFMRSLGIEAISLDSIKDDTGRRLVENLKSVAWNGIKVSFHVLEEIYPSPGIESTKRNPVKVTVMGAGAVGMFAIQAAIRYGDEDYWQKLGRRGVTGVQVTAIEYDLTNHDQIMQQILRYTDILVDATQRVDPSHPVIPNSWIGVMRPHAVLLDLSVDPYLCDANPPSVKGIEGIPHGNLDQYVFNPDDQAFDRIPSCVNTHERRHSVSCYSWPGIYPQECMDIYGKQLEPILRNIIENHGIRNMNRRGGFFQRAIRRALLSQWQDQFECK